MKTRAVIALGLLVLSSRPVFAQEGWACTFLGWQHKPQIIKLQAKGDKLIRTLSGVGIPGELHLLLNNNLVVVAATGNAGNFENAGSGRSFADGEIIVINKKTLVFHWSYFAVEQPDDTVLTGSCVAD